MEGREYMNTFNDEDYLQRVFDVTHLDANTLETIQTAFNIAHEIRRFEIELFWKRGTYFWAFILASFTAYFATIDKILGDGKICLTTLKEIPLFSKFILLLIICLCFFFCLSWILISKGSKFWQKNWESHIDFLETFVSGKIYKTILNTKNKEFNKCPLKTEAFDYSVTIITTVGAIFLTCITAILVLFHSFLVLNDIISLNTDYIYTFLGIGILVIFVVALKELLKSEGNQDIHRKINKEQNSSKWRQR